MKLLHGDCLDLMKEIPDNSVDLVLTDPPYGTTQCKWDSVIPFEPMWKQLKRITKDNGAVALFGAEPFSSALRMSNTKMFKYDWYWEKNLPSGVSLAKYQPMRVIECIHIFYQKNPAYNKQLVETVISDRKIVDGRKNGSGNNGSNHIRMNKVKNIQKTKVNPRNLLKIKCVPNAGGHKLHPTQKPVALLEYLIKTYTQKNETVLDFTMGSGSTGVAAKNLNREFIGIEQDDYYFQLAKARIEGNEQELERLKELKK